MFDRRSFLVLLVPFSFLGGSCHESGDPEPTPLAALPVGTHNLGHESVGHAFDGEWIVSLLPERLVDRNGDGDGVDLVPVVTDARTGRERVLPWAASAVTVGGGFVAFTVSEFDHGQTDLNRDGDQRDHVLFVHELRSGRTRNLGLAVDPARLEQRGDLLAADAGDGLAVSRLSTGVLVQYDGVLASSPRISADLVVAEVREDGRDRNRDGDGDDVVVTIVDAVLGTVRSLERAIVPNSTLVDGDLLAYRIREEDQGAADLDGDGDADDEPVELVDLATDQRFLVTAPVLAAQLGGGLALLYLAESAAGAPSVDRNGDGDTDDYVFAFFDHLSFTLTETGLAAGNSGRPPVPALNERKAAFCVGEEDQGTDLDGDGEVNDLVLALFDGASGRVHVTGRTCEWGHEMLGIDARRAVYPVPDPSVPGVRRAAILDLASGDVTPLDLAVTRMNLVGSELLCAVPEWLQGTDLNGDGQLASAVLVVIDVETDLRKNTGVGVASFPPWADPALIGDRLLVPTTELFQFADLNGDGDALDPVLQLVRLR